MAHTTKMDQKALRDWIREGLEQIDPNTGQKRTASELARRIGVERTAVSKILSGVRQVKAREIPKIAEYLGSQIPFEKFHPPIQSRVSIFPSDSLAVYYGDIAARVWKDMCVKHAESTDKIHKFPTERYAQHEQGFLRVTDDSCNLYAQKGEIVWVVEYDKVRPNPRNPQHGDYVVVERTRQVVTSEEKITLSEMTIRRVVRTNGTIVLKWLSNAQALGQDIIFEEHSDDVAIKHLVIAVGRFMDY